MKNLFAAILFAFSFGAFAAPMTNDDVIKMVKAGLGESVVLQAIDGAEPKFDTSTDGLIQLKQNGVNDAVIQRIMQRVTGATAPAPAAANATLPRSGCQECGTVQAVREIEGSRKVGAGTATGAVLGGVLGYAAGGPRHRGAGTVVGAVGGAAAGNMIENRGGNSSFEMTVRFDDGRTQTFRQGSGYTAGSRVRVMNGVISPL